MWLREAVGLAGLRVVPLTVDVADRAVRLGREGFHRDPVDRVVYATALVGRTPLITRDAAIRTFDAGPGGAGLTRW